MMNEDFQMMRNMFQVTGTLMEAIFELYKDDISQMPPRVKEAHQLNTSINIELSKRDPNETVVTGLMQKLNKISGEIQSGKV